jgi:DNA-binding MarR family transcriptional regulator
LDVTSSEIGKTLDIQRANMVPVLNRLEHADLICRTPLDGRSQAIVLTPLGLATALAVHSITSQFEADLMARIPQEHREPFVAALQALAGQDV